MYYATALVKDRDAQNSVSAEQAFAYLFGQTNRAPLEMQSNIRHFQRTYTKQLEEKPPYPAGYGSWFTDVLTDWRIFSQATPVAEHYHKFLIPKSSGGYREINAPCDELKRIQRTLVYKMARIPGMSLTHVHAHNSAFAYVPGRSAKHAIEEHQRSGSQWFLKLDLKDFFPSCTKDFVVEQLTKVYPFCHISQPYLNEIVDVCMLDGALPQGSPASPFITNLLMVEYDKKICDLLYPIVDKHYVYTRYADDILISARVSFPWGEVAQQIQDILLPTPFKIKHEKTRYGSRAGRNWNLGIMLNKDNNMTLGHKRKQELRAMVNNFLQAAARGEYWDTTAAYVLMGQLSYLGSIEPEYKKFIIERSEQKWQTTMAWAMQRCMNPI